MSTVFVPEVGERINVIPAKETIVTGLLNAPTEGTRIRATLGETIIVGTVGRDSAHELITVIPDGLNHIWGHTGYTDCWIGAGWTFEILDTPEAAA